MLSACDRYRNEEKNILVTGSRLSRVPVANIGHFWSSYIGHRHNKIAPIINLFSLFSCYGKIALYFQLLGFFMI